MDGLRDDGDDGTGALLAAGLWSVAGEPDIAVRGLLRAGQSASARGALVTAGRLLEQARTLPVTDPALRAAVVEALVEVLALAAKVDEALAVGAEALVVLEVVRASVDRPARVHLAMARAADAAGRWSLAEHHLGQARRFGREVGDEGLLAAVDALAAHVAMGEFRYDDAERLAGAAAEQGARLGLPEIECEALEVLGRRERLRDLGRAEKIFTRAHDRAREHGLVLWSMRALHELGAIDMLQRTDAVRLRQASELAYRAGALSLAATVDLQLVGLHAMLFEPDRALEAGARTVDVAGTLGLAEVHAAALLQMALAHAVAGDRPAVEATVEEALRVGGHRPEAQALAWGHARATASLLAEDRARALEELEVAVGWARQVRGLPGVFVALWALLRVVEGAGAEVVIEAQDLIPVVPINLAILDAARAVLDARGGDAERAAARVAATDDSLRRARFEGWRHAGPAARRRACSRRRLGRPGRLADRCGQLLPGQRPRPVWPQRCRDLLRRAGHTPSGPNTGRVPPPLRAAGVTAREMDVLDLVGERLSNREIAERLYLSPRTVEKHVERLLHKTGVADRGELGRLARRVRAAPPVPT